MKKSEFTGGLLPMIGYGILIWLVTIFTLGIATPFVMVAYFRWEAGHTHIQGRQLKFVGKGGELFLKFLLWMFLTLITLGIFGIWVSIKFLRWKVENTVFADESIVEIEG
ncbi:MAG: DUF898 family protein [Christensenellales bacterium]|jgi:uncharacterized membrane protein YjgN (DUF898 family)